MCVIVDANRAAAFGDTTDEHFRPVREWLLRGGVLVYGGRLAAELARVSAAQRLVAALLRSGNARLVAAADVGREEHAVAKTGLCKSNDPHVVALVRLSGARTVCTEDKALWADLKNRALVNPVARIYRTKKHWKLLRHEPPCRNGRRK